MNWDKIREDFPATKNSVALNNAGASPLPKPVYEEVVKFYDDFLNYGEDDEKFLGWLARVDETRKLIADFINAKPEEIAFNHSVSEGMNAIAHMLVGKGDVIANELEFPSSTLPWINKGFNVKFVKATNGKIKISDIKKELDSKTKIILTSHVQYSNGFRQNLEDLGKLVKENNLSFIVNTTQSLGAVEFDMKKANADFMCCIGFKWLLAGYRSGLLVVKEELLDKLYVPSVGPFAMKNHSKFDNRVIDLANTARKFEPAAPDFPDIFALNAAIRYIQNIGIKSIEDRILNLTDYLIEKLQESKFEIVSPLERKYRSGIIVFKHNNPLEKVRELSKKKILVSARGEGIRVSPHFFNNEEDIDTLIKNIK